MSNARDKANIPALNFSSTGIDDNATSTAITIDSGGDVGIGTTNAFTKLVVEGDSNSNVAVVNAIGTAPNYIFDARDDGTSVFRIDGSGNVGIGTTSPSDTANRVTLELNDTWGGRIRNSIGGTANSEWTISTSNIALFGTIVSQPLAFTTNNLERMRIDSSGNVGIGTTSPQEQVDISSTAPRIRFSDTSVTNLRHVIGSEANDLEIRCDDGNVYSNSHIGFKIDGSERMRIDSDGNLIVGSINTTGIPTGSSVNVGAYISGNGPGSFISQANAESNIYLSKASGYTQSKFVRFFVTGTERGSIDTNGSSVSYNTSSDYRLKENVSYDFDATTRLKQLKPARFNFIADANTTVDGFLAHEVSSVVPEAINGEKDAVDENGNPVYQGIDQSKLVPLLVKTIQELEARITALEANNP